MSEGSDSEVVDVENADESDSSQSDKSTQVDSDDVEHTETEIEEIERIDEKEKSEKKNRGRKGKHSPDLKKKRRSSSCASSAISNPSITPERLKELREIVEKAAQHHKTFTILGRYPSIREALKSRGWVQNFDLQRLTLPKQRQFDDDVSVLARLQSADETERLVISRLLRHTPVSFLWATSENIDWNSLSKSTLVSRFPRVYFTTKVGICNYLQQSHWFCEAGISNTMFPRCYSISSSDDLDVFIKDFRLTACISLLKKLISFVDDKSQVFDDNGKIPLKTVEFAVKRLSELAAKERHEDIDRETEEKVWDHQWDQFLTLYYQFVHHNHKFVSATEEQISEMYSCSKMALDVLDEFWPQKNMDGTNNLWIVKPGAKSRGRGIVVLNKLEDIVARVSCFQSNEPRFVVQKYIERPLLIYNTKFDIRQWFLVTSVYPLTIWMYKESYLRFCSQLFSLTNMHESVHLSNNAIQCKYKNASKRDRALPDENMWDCYTFKTYLRTLGFSDRWETVIYSGMRECITGALLAAQEHMEHRRNCFELYGADFMLTEDLVPWLIEINSSPCMSPTTSVTARMCSQCLEDVIKVVIDKRYNKDADTGMFELAYRQQVSNPQPYMGMNLTVKGNKIGRSGIKSRNGSKGSEDLTRDLGSSSVKEAIKRLSDRLKDDSQSEETESEVKAEENTTSGVSSGVETDSTPRRVKEEPKKRTYKKHCCVRRASITQAVARYKSRNYEDIARRLRLQSENIKCKTVQIPQATELFDWRKRIEQTRSNCRKMLQKISQIEKMDQLPNVNKIERISLRKCGKIYSSKINLPDISSPKREINNNNINLTKITNKQLPSCA